MYITDVCYYRMTIISSVYKPPDLATNDLELGLSGVCDLEVLDGW